MNQWSSHSRDMVESFKRYYNNSFLDRQRQEAYNLFLGNYTFTQGQPMLWDLSTDYYLHHADPKKFAANVRKTYARWYTPKNLEDRAMPTKLSFELSHKKVPMSKIDNYWLEYYRPFTISSFLKILSYKMSSKLQYNAYKTTQEGGYDLSPFRARAVSDSENVERGRSAKDLALNQPQLANIMDDESLASHNSSPARQTTLPRWLQGHLHQQLRHERQNSNPPAVNRDKLLPNDARTMPIGTPPKDTSAAIQWSLNQFVNKSLNPSVSDSEAHEYQRYIDHPLNLSLLAFQDTSPHTSSDFSRYVSGSKIQRLETEGLEEAEVAEYAAFLENGDDPLTVTEADTSKKRYKAYRQWLKGKSLFKQQRVEV